MYFQTLNDLLHMDGHGGFVWTAYIISVIVIFLILVAPLRRQRGFLRQLAGELKRQQGADNGPGDT